MSTDTAARFGPRVTPNESVCPVCGRESCDDPAHIAPDDEPEQTAARRTLRAFTEPELAAHTFPPRRVLLYREIPERVQGRDTVPLLKAGRIWQIAAMRGVGKTWLTHTAALVAATARDALGFAALEPCRVLLVDGEMAADEIQERIRWLRSVLDLPPAPNLVIVGADWQDDPLRRLDTPGGQADIEAFIEAADLVCLDNRSCLFDPESEKDGAVWQRAQTWLLELRRRGKAIIVDHHANRLGGARGHSRPEDIIDLSLKLSWPEGYTADQGAQFVAEWDKARGVHGAAVAPFAASLTPKGWIVQPAHDAQQRGAAERLREYLRLADAIGERPRSCNQACAKVRINRSDAYKLWRVWQQTGELGQDEHGGWYLHEVAP